MDPISNPYSPGAGTKPPALAGRDELREKIRIGLERIRAGRAAKSILMVGLRGVGKTVLLDQIMADAEAAGIHTLRMEAPEHKSLPALLAPSLRGALLKLSRTEKAMDLGQRALRALAGFAKSLKVKYNDIEVAIDYEPETGLADNGDLESDLTDLFEAAGRSAREASTALVLFIDELQYVAEDELAILITVLHRCAQRQLPISLVGAGLPQLRGKMGEAKSYAERLFDFPEIGPLPRAAADEALALPAEELNVSYTKDALERIFADTHGYPYFLQEWGKHAWDVAVESPITAEIVEVASREAIAALDAGFFGVRFDRLSQTEKAYMRAMAELGSGPHRSGDVAERIGKNITKLGTVRSSLIMKGMIFSPTHGETAFTVPLFDEYMRRIMPLTIEK